MSGHTKFPNLTIVDHPLVQHKLTILRDRETSTSKFNQVLEEVALLLGYEVTRSLKLTTREIETPMVPMQAPCLEADRMVIVSILRAGLGMVGGLRALMPTSFEGHVGLYRDPTTHEPVEYLVKLPAVKEGRVFIVSDPMLATGNSAAHAVDVLVDHGVSRSNIRFMALVAAPEGIERFNRDHGEVPIFTASLDDGLNDHAYIIPGLGDAGDRLFGTED
ncbi:MAG: uracil phosphoribosyltransferase [Rhodospirillaceae bacterium]|nr:uracil phosphoribosyltransferase [Rhodospirillaceae bacterium]